MLMKIVYLDGSNVKVKKGDFLKEDEFFVHITTLAKEVRIGKRFIVEMFEIQ